MNLLERAKSLSLEIQAIDALKKRADQAVLFEKRAKDLAAPVDELSNLEEAVRVIASLHIPAPLIDRSLVGSLRDRIVDLRSRYSSDKNVVLDPFPGEDVRWVLNQPLSQLSQKVKAALLAAWGNWSRANIPDIDKDVLEILAGIIALSDSVATVRNLKAKAETVCASLPGGVDDLERLRKLCEEISAVWHNLAGEGIPADVLIFLRSAGNREGAKFDLLTSEVLAWLAVHGLRDALRIRMG